MPHSDANVNISVCTSGNFPSAPPAPPDNQRNANDNKLSTGAVIGIVVGTMVAAVILTCAIVLFVLKKRDDTEKEEMQSLKGSDVKAFPQEYPKMSLSRVHQANMRV